MRTEDALTWASDGELEYLSTEEESYTETIIFKDGTGNTSKRIDSLDSATWIGDSGGTITWAEGESLLSIDERGGIAEVTYTRQYDRWALHTYTATKVLAAFAPVPLDAPKRYYYGAGTSIANSVSDDWLIDSNAKKLRARAELRKSLKRKTISMRIPLDRKIRDGYILALSDELQGMSGNVIVDKCDIVIEKVKTYYNLECHQCRP